ncbi:MAG: imidazoleglycerol-phosphate dehydratase HisB [Armatimonadetes bacterium]|nr:imidazoleglycerol-phosphate dehydratase HisB [Armatimonadota bacterium]
MSSRIATVTRETKETQVSITLDLDGTGHCQVNTGVGFFDHMLSHIARHGMVDLTVAAGGDLEVDAHHVVEDVGITLGQALGQALGEKRGLRRYGWSAAPMDEALVLVAVDLSGRPALEWRVELPAARVGEFDVELAREFFQAVANNAAITLHFHQLAGRNTHHILESAFKSFGRALDEACRPDPRLGDAVPSTKGTL